MGDKKEEIKAKVSRILRDATPAKPLRQEIPPAPHEFPPDNPNVVSCPQCARRTGRYSELCIVCNYAVAAHFDQEDKKRVERERAIRAHELRYKLGIPFALICVSVLMYVKARLMHMPEIGIVLALGTFIAGMYGIFSGKVKDSVRVLVLVSVILLLYYLLYSTIYNLPKLDVVPADTTLPRMFSVEPPVEEPFLHQNIFNGTN